MLVRHEPGKARSDETREQDAAEDTRPLRPHGPHGKRAQHHRAVPEPGVHVQRGFGRRHHLPDGVLAEEAVEFRIDVGTDVGDGRVPRPLICIHPEAFGVLVGAAHHQ